MTQIDEAAREVHRLQEIVRRGPITAADLKALGDAYRRLLCLREAGRMTTDGRRTTLLGGAGDERKGGA